jgi:hypothetical protein
MALEIQKMRDELMALAARRANLLPSAPKPQLLTVFAYGLHACTNPKLL